MKEFDLIIVGAGPAGSTLGYHMARSGFKTLIIDKEAFPRYKACGGGLPPRTVGLLDFDVSHLFSNTVHGVKLSCGPKVSVDFFGGTTVHLVHRKEFDDFLLKKAIEQGVEFIGGEFVTGIKENADSVEVITKKNRYSAKYLAGCDGARSVVARALGFKQKNLSFCIDADVYLPEDVLAAQKDYACLDTNCVPKGYGWVFPKDNFVSVGLGTTRRKIPKFKSYFRDFIARMPETKGAYKVEFHGGFNPYYVRGAKHWNSRRTILAGDSTGLVDPLSGEGIYYAIRGAIVAAEVLASDAGTDEYSRRIGELFLPDLNIARRMASVYYHTPKIIFRTFMKARRARRYMELFARLMAGEISYTQLYDIMHPKK